MSLTDEYIPIPVVLYIDRDTNEPDLEVLGDPEEADREAIYHRFVRGEEAVPSDVEFRLSDVFPLGELYTLFSGETKECGGLFRTSEEADTANKHRNGKNYPKYAVLRIAFDE